MVCCLCALLRRTDLSEKEKKRKNMINLKKIDTLSFIGIGQTPFRSIKKKNRNYFVFYSVSRVNISLVFGTRVNWALFVYSSANGVFRTGLIYDLSIKFRHIFY